LKLIYKKEKSPSVKALKGFNYKEMVEAGKRLSQLLYEGGC